MEVGSKPEDALFRLLVHPQRIRPANDKWGAESDNWLLGHGAPPAIKQLSTCTEWQFRKQRRSEGLRLEAGEDEEQAQLVCRLRGAEVADDRPWETQVLGVLHLQECYRSFDLPEWNVWWKYWKSFGSKELTSVACNIRQAKTWDWEAKPRDAECTNEG